MLLAANALELGKSLSSAVLKVEHRREIESREVEIRTARKRFTEKLLRRWQLPQPKRDFGEHPPGDEVVRAAVDDRAEDGLGARQIVRHQCSSRSLQQRIMLRCKDR
jgi:hypothetical protein